MKRALLRRFSLFSMQSSAPLKMVTTLRWISRCRNSARNPNGWFSLPTVLLHQYSDTLSLCLISGSEKAKDQMNPQSGGDIFPLTKPGCAQISVNTQFSHSSTFQFRESKEWREKPQAHKNWEWHAMKDSMMQLNWEQRWGYVQVHGISPSGPTLSSCCGHQGKESLRTCSRSMSSNLSTASDSWYIPDVQLSVYCMLTLISQLVFLLSGPAFTSLCGLWPKDSTS